MLEISMANIRLIIKETDQHTSIKLEMGNTFFMTMFFTNVFFLSLSVFLVFYIDKLKGKAFIDYVMIADGR